MLFSRSQPAILALGLAVAMACGPSFRVGQYRSSESLFGAGIAQVRERKWDNAVQAFERLTLELPARDSLLPLSHYYLAQAYSGRGDHLLAAQAYLRMAESFATDTLADQAMYRAGREYQRMWRRPTLDPQYGGEATIVYQTLLGLYPDSPWADSATAQLRLLQEMYATKDYETAMHYVRRRAWDSAIIYLRDVVERYPEAARARDAYLRLAEAYDAIRYRDDKNDVCNTLRERYPQDREVVAVCGRPVVAPAAQATPARRDTT
ncbi:MAG TPA: outer membrane protein assembly factor BamD [Gemmatimonadaceae bacterium]|nr:outer membrane protein assembly factor BamD [Gemmatimonadaceae bacterium]